mgnify:CR=1 FL=1
MRFEELELPPELMRGIEDAGFVQTTPVQEKSLHWTLDGHDVAAQAQTGTGKTAAFLITTFTRLLENGLKARPGRPRALCLAPTRELALQIASDAMQLGKHTGLTIGTIYGGVGFDTQRHQLQKGLDVCIATPGRLIDFLQRGECKLTDIEVIVIDEADRMFDMGFYPDIRQILRRSPTKHERQMMIFSATLNFRVIELGYEFMLDPKEITVDPEQITVREIEERLYHVGKSEKLALLIGLMRNLEPERAIVFCNTKVWVENVANALTRYGIPAQAISGDIAQAMRVMVLDRFKFSLEIRPTRSLPIRASFRGSPATGFILEEIRIRPSEVEVRGPHSLLTAARQIETLPIPLEGRNESFSTRTTLSPALDGQNITTSLPPGEILVEVVLREEDVTRTLTVPLVVLAPSGFPFRYLLPEESVTLAFRGAPRFLSQPELLKVYLDLSEYPPETLKSILLNYARDNPAARVSLPLSYTLRRLRSPGPPLEGEPKVPVRFLLPLEEKP